MCHHVNLEKVLQDRKDNHKAVYDGEIDELKQRLLPVLGREDLRILFGGMLHNPEDHENLMRELILKQGFDDVEPQEVFWNTAYLGIDILTSSIARAVKEKDLQAAINLTDQAEKLALKINEPNRAEKLWLLLDDMLREVELTDSSTTKLILLRISDAYEKKEYYDVSREILGYLKEVAEAHDNLREVTNIDLREADIFRKMARFDEAKALFNAVIGIATAELNDLQVSSCAWLGLARIENAGTDMDQAIKFYRNAVREASESQETEVYLAASDELGLVYAQADQYHESWECLEEAFNLALKQMDIAAMLNIIETMWYPCQNLKNYGSYLIVLRTVRHQVQAAGLNDILGPVLIGLARVQLALGNTNEASRHIDEARSTYSAISYEEGLQEVEALAASLPQQQ